MTGSQRTRTRITDMLNGDWEDLDQTTRRALIVIADEVDGVHAEIRVIRKQIEDLRRTVLGVGASTVTILVSSAIVVLFTR